MLCLHIIHPWKLSGDVLSGDHRGREEWWIVYMSLEVRQRQMLKGNLNSKLRMRMRVRKRLGMQWSEEILCSGKVAEWIRSDCRWVFGNGKWEGSLGIWESGLELGSKVQCIRIGIGGYTWNRNNWCLSLRLLSRRMRVEFFRRSAWVA
jgi:hypothetical protein